MPLPLPASESSLVQADIAFCWGLAGNRNWQAVKIRQRAINRTLRLMMAFLALLMVEVGSVG